MALIDARLIADAGGQTFVCARHCANSFILLDPKRTPREPLVACYAASEEE